MRNIFKKKPKKQAEPCPRSFNYTHKYIWVPNAYREIYPNMPDDLYEYITGNTEDGVYMEIEREVTMIPISKLRLIPKRPGK